MKYLKYFEQINPEIDIDVIIESYFEAALWMSETSDDHEKFDDKTIWNFSYNAKKQAKEEIEWFIDNAGSVFDDVDKKTIGHDLWLTRNNHGSGFFDRSGYDEDDAEFLTELAKILGEVDIEVNDKGWIDFHGNSEKYKNFDLEKYFEDRKLKKAENKYNL